MKFQIAATVGLLLATTVCANSLEPVLRAEEARCAALLNKDVAALSSLLADDYHYIHSTGREQTKSDVLSEISSGKTAYDRLEVTNLKAQPVTFDVVVVTGLLNQRKLSGGQWKDARLLFHAVWRNQSGTWQQVSLQTVLAPKSSS